MCDPGGYAFTREDGTTGTTARRVRRVIDVRSEFELRLWPDPYARHPQPGIRCIGIPMLDQLNSSDFADTLPACMFDV